MLLMVDRRSLWHDLEEGCILFGSYVNAVPREQGGRCDLYRCVGLNRGLSVYLGLYPPDFQKSFSKYLCFTKVVRKHGIKCFTAMCKFSMQCFSKSFSELLHH